MLERKTNKADIDRLRPFILSVTFLTLIGLFFLALNLRFYVTPEAIVEKAIEEIAVNVKLPPLPEQDKNIVAAEITQQPSVSSKINLVDNVQEQRREELKRDIKFNTLEDEGIEDPTNLEQLLSPPVTELEDAPLRIVEELPEFPGGMSGFVQWLTKSLRYPARSKSLKQQGTVIVSFVVEKDGTTSNIKFIKQTHTALDAEVLRVLRIMPKWTPAKQHGEACRAVIAVPFVFAM